MKKKLFAGVGAVVLSFSILGSVMAESNGQSEIAQARNATAKYHDKSVAIADGYVPTEINAVIPGVGIMGYHYINFKELADPSINPEKPEVLIYVPSKDRKDGVRLVAVEYVVAAEDWSFNGETFEGWSSEEPPSVFGQTFEGPMDGHAPGEPRHFDKHVWLWQANPKGFNIDENFNFTYDIPGIFSQWNPTVNQK